jgi:[histone H3]-lysine9 N-trimethyltransferase SUV39H
MSASVKIKSESGYSSSRSSSLSNNNDHPTIKVKVRQTNLMDFFFNANNNAKENKNNNEIVSNDINSTPTDRLKSANSLDSNNVNENKTGESQPELVKTTSQDLIQPKTNGNTIDSFGSRRSRRQSVSDVTERDVKIVPKNYEQMLAVKRRKSVCLVPEILLSEKANENYELNDNEPRILEAETEVVIAADKSFGSRRSRRQSICVEKLTYEKVKPKKFSYKKFIDEIAPLPDIDDEKTVDEEKKVLIEAPKKRIYRRKSICAAAFKNPEDESSYIDPFVAMLLRTVAKQSSIDELILQKPSNEDSVIITKPAQKSLPKTIVNSKRLHENVEKSAIEVKQSAKRQKTNETDFEEIEHQVVQPAIVEEVIEDIWYVSVMIMDKEPVVRFLVKWDGFPPTENTLEPFEHVSHAEILQDYVKRKFEMHQDKIEGAIEQLATEAKTQLDFYQEKAKSFVKKKLAKFDVLHFRCNILAYIYTYEKLPQWCLYMRHLRTQCVLYKFFEKVEKEQKANNTFLSKIMKKEKNLFAITSENKLDYDSMPQFEYLRNADFPKLKSKTGCKCEGACNESSSCCPSLKGVKPVYDVDGRICALSHQMIVECNDNCKCDHSCPNRPKRTKFSLCVFKTADRGWAVKTLDHIPAGAFVIEYTGELIDMTEAKKRTRVYKKLGITYLFDLDYNEKNEATYSLDATHKGNLSRFINHSCNANLQTWPATSCDDIPETHRLYYFSLRSIRAGEELTVDYSGGVIRPIINPPKDAIACKCNSDNCRGYIF